MQTEERKEEEKIEFYVSLHHLTYMIVAWIGTTNRACCGLGEKSHHRRRSDLYVSLSMEI